MKKIFLPKLRLLHIIIALTLLLFTTTNLLSSEDMRDQSHSVTAQQNDPFDNDDDTTNDPFDNDDDTTNDPFDNDDNTTNDPDDLFGEDDGKSFVPIPDLMINGHVGLALSSLFLNNNNEFVQKINQPEKKYRYLACDVYGNVSIDYKFFSMHLFGSFDVLATIDTLALPKFKIDVRELYLSYVNNFMVIRLGHLLVEWSTMNVFSVTNYFNPYSDMIYSKQFLKGINGVHAQFYFAGNMSMELVYIPLLTKSSLNTTRINPLLAGSLDITSIDMGSIIDDLIGEDGIFNDPNDTDSQLIKVYNIDNSAPSFSLLNTQGGLRYGVKFNGIDLYLSYFHGYDKNPMFSYTHTELELEEDDPSVDLTKFVKVNVKREYRIIDSFGLSTTFNVWKINFNGEVGVTINDPIMFEREVVVNGETFVDRAITTSPTMEISLGLRWEFNSDWLFIAEFKEFIIFKDIDPIKNSSPSGSIFTALAYTMRFEPVDTMFTQAVYFDYHDLQLITVSYIRMDFKMGLYGEIGIGYMNDIKAVIDKRKMTEGLFGLFNRSVILAINVYYEF